MSETEFGFGDRLIHEGRPEWGVGVVTSAQAIKEEGNACQRLTLRFEREGLKTVSTAHAKFRRAETALDDTRGHESDPKVLNGDAGWLAKLESEDPAELMARLPENTRDPFATLGSRLNASLALYRFSDQGSSLLDWAAMQTGLRDPLSHFSRQELESFFKRFARVRDEWLKELAQDVRKNPPADLKQIIDSAPEAGQKVLRSLHPAR